MKVKKYKLFKTAQKTARENNLVLKERNSNKDVYSLFDFSELETLYGIDDKSKEYIKKSALKNVCYAFSSDLYGKEFDNFTYIDGESKFYCHRVYDSHGKMLYRIFQLVSLNHRYWTRKSIYDAYTATTFEMSVGYKPPINDYEI